MRIITKHKDYYDFIAGYDTDPRKIYLRRNLINPKEWQRSDKDYIQCEELRFDMVHSTLKLFLGEVWFCDRNYRYVHNLITNEFYWEYDKIPEYIINLYCKKRNLGLRNRWNKDEDHEENGLMNYFGIYVRGEGWGNNPTKLREKFENLYQAKLNTKYKEPIIITRYREYMGEVVFGGVLKDIQFNLIKPPQEAFTELYNWIPYFEPEMPNDPMDTQRFEGKGFDKKTSFRHPVKPPKLK
jgi:hypothetical protein